MRARRSSPSRAQPRARRTPLRGGLAGAALAAALSLAACGNLPGPFWPVIPPDIPAPKLVDESANAGSVTLARTQWLLVRLPIEANGPFRWTYEVAGDALYPSGITPRFETDQAGVRNEILTFRAEGTGTATLRFAYRNLDSPQLPPARIVAFDVVAH